MSSAVSRAAAHLEWSELDVCRELVMPGGNDIRHPIPIECEQSIYEFLLFPNEQMVGKRRSAHEPLSYLAGNTRTTKEITFPATTSNLSFVAIPSDLLRADETKRLYRGMINRSRYFGMSK